MKKIIFTSLAIFFSVSINAFATGQGGIAGSSSMIVVASKVTDVSTSIAIGKSTAHSNAHTTATTVQTFAGGTGGTVTVAATGDISSIVVEGIAGLAKSQANAMNSGTVKLDAINGTHVGQAKTPQ